MHRAYYLFLSSLTAAVLYAAPNQTNSGTNNAQQQSNPITYGGLPKTLQTMTSGLWRVDEGFVSTIQVRNLRTADSITVTPTLYMADGTSYPLSMVTLAASESQTINVNEALAKAPMKVVVHESSFGSAALAYTGNIGAITAAMTLVNAPASLSYTWQMQFSISGTASMQTLEGLWWRHDDGVDGFIAISNSTSQEKQIEMQLVTALGRQMPVHSLTVSAYSTKMLELSALTGGMPQGEKRAGGIRVEFNGQLGDINVAGGLANWTEGYSAVMPFWTTMNSMMASMNRSESMPPAQQTLSNVGVMVGSPDPMMGFPAKTVFTPYIALRNTTAKPITMAITAYQQSGQAYKAPPEVLAGYETKDLDTKQLMKNMGVGNVNGTLTFSISYMGQLADLIEAAGSVDQTGTYVFEVPAKAAETSLSKEVPYWSTGNGNDTMVTVWNSSSTAEDLTLTLHFVGGTGTYVLPIHLDAYTSSTLDVMQIIMSQQPDASGNKIPANVTEGGMTLASAKGLSSLITANLNVGIFNVTTATCYYGCIACNGYYTSWLATTPFNVTVGAQGQEIDCAEMNTGEVDNVGGSWSSSNTSIASVDGYGNVTGITPGSATLTASVYLNAETEVCAYNPSCYSVSSEDFVASGPTSVNCNFPTGETTQFYQWADNPPDPSVGNSPAIAEFYQTLTPAANYGGLTTITEGNASSATDSCWFNGAIQSYGPPVQYDPAPVSGDSGSSWSIVGGAWGNDKVGMGYTLFGSYQSSLPQRGLTSCTITMFQTLTAACSNGTAQQFDGTVVLNIIVTGGGISVTREGVNAARTLVAQ